MSSNKTADEFKDGPDIFTADLLDLWKGKTNYITVTRTCGSCKHSRPIKSLNVADSRNTANLLECHFNELLVFRTPKAGSCDCFEPDLSSASKVRNAERARKTRLDLLRLVESAGSDVQVATKALEVLKEKYPQLLEQFVTAAKEQSNETTTPVVLPPEEPAVVVDPESNPEEG